LAILNTNTQLLTQQHAIKLSQVFQTFVNYNFKANSGITAWMVAYSAVILVTYYELLAQHFANGAEKIQAN
jgi:hypothetical protein